jgi:hypothetical protein
MGIKKMLFGDPGMQYRIRVFDHGFHIKTATVPNRGQDRITLTVKGKDFGLFGEEIKLAFMINPIILPRIFGNIMEIDFDVRDATQLGDLMDICPDLVYELNEEFAKTYDALIRNKNNVLDAEFTEETEEKRKETEKEFDDTLNALTDPAPEKEPEPGKELTPFEQKVEKIPGVRTATLIIESIAEVPENIKKNKKARKILADIEQSKDHEKNEKIRKALEFCSQPGNQKCLRWLPKRLKIEPEVMAIVSQMELDGVGISPMYYIKQGAAEISEKMLTRPKSPEDWKTTAIIIIGIIGALGIVMFGLMKLSGAI